MSVDAVTPCWGDNTEQPTIVGAPMRRVLSPPLERLRLSLRDDGVALSVDLTEHMAAVAEVVARAKRGPLL